MVVRCISCEQTLYIREGRQTGFTFLLFPMMPSLGQIYGTEHHRLPPAFSMHPTTINTPVSRAILSSSSRVPSPRPLPPSSYPGSCRRTHLNPAPALPSPTVSPRSTAFSKYCANDSRPSAERLPTTAPKVVLRGYPPIKASGSRRMSTPRSAARRAMPSRWARVSLVVA